MKAISVIMSLIIIPAMGVKAEMPIYQNDSYPIEERVFFYCHDYKKTV